MLYILSVWLIFITCVLSGVFCRLVVVVWDVANELVGVQQESIKLFSLLLEKPAEADGAPLGGRLKLCEGDTRIHRIWRAIVIIDVACNTSDEWLQ